MDDERYKKVLKYRIDEVMHYIWDPIGVSDAPEARNEYSSYADFIWRAVLEGKSKEKIAEILTKDCTERMGLDPRKKHDEKVAEIILDWADFLKHPYEI